MSEIKKLTPEELQKIQDLRNQYVALTTQMGQVKVEQLVLSDQFKNLQELEVKLGNDYRALQTEENELAKSITEKYGDGEINVETGEFISTTQTV